MAPLDDDKVMAGMLRRTLRVFFQPSEGPAPRKRLSAGRLCSPPTTNIRWAKTNPRGTTCTFRNARVAANSLPQWSAPKSRRNRKQIGRGYGAHICSRRQWLRSRLLSFSACIIPRERPPSINRLPRRSSRCHSKVSRLRKTRSRQNQQLRSRQMEMRIWDSHRQLHWFLTNSIRFRKRSSLRCRPLQARVKQYNG